ncbi:MAG TPA: hypothetical protein VGN21_15590 [Stellaceae bacterium]|jgi:DMSO reductase anchor subunit
MFKNPVAQLVIGLLVVSWGLYQLFGPHDEAPSQGVVILTAVMVILGAAGVIGSLMRIGTRKA